MAGRLVVAALLLANVGFAAERDLSVGWIARNPKIDYVWNSSNPTREGWPEEGSAITWVANVRWLGEAPISGVGYHWLVDGQLVRAGTLNFAPESLVQSELTWTWTFARHEIVFEIDPDNKIAEAEERNNKLLVYSNAIAVGLYVERSFWNGIQDLIRPSNIGAITFDDWMQRRIRQFNEMALYAIFPETPDGVIDRWRIDEIHLVEDNTLPLTPPYSEARDWGAKPTQTSLGTLYPNVLDHTVDMQWGFPAETVSYFIAGPWTMMAGNSFVHELGHARTMIDTYAWTLTPQGDILQLDPKPLLKGRAYYTSLEHGMMNLDWGHLDRYSAVMMNRMAGRRAISGNYNEPWDIGWFLNDLPARNRVRLLRPDGTAIANRSVKIYRASGETIDLSKTEPYAMVFDKVPDLQLTTDREGIVILPRNPFSSGEVVAAVDRMNGIAIVEIMDGNTRRFAYLDSLQFNLAFSRGETTDALHEIVTDPPFCFDRLGPSAVLPAPESRVSTAEVRFEFAAEQDRPYDLYYAIDGGAPQRVAVPPVTGSHASHALTLPPGRVVWWLIDPNPSLGCPPQHSTIYAFDHVIETPQRRRAARK